MVANLSGIEAEMHQEAEKEARKSLQGIGIPTMMKEERAIDQTNSAIAPTSIGAYVDSLSASALYDRIGVNNLGTVAADTVFQLLEDQLLHGLLKLVLLLMEVKILEK